MIIALASPCIASVLDEGLDRIKRCLSEASAQGAEIVCFSEAYLPGLRGQDFQVLPWDQTQQKRALQAVTQWARTYAVATILGMEVHIRLQALELKIPPPAVAVLMAGAMWGIALVAPLLEVPTFIRVVSTATIALAGVGFSLAGIISFRRARTTVNPMKPETTTALVCSGIYGVT